MVQAGKRLCILGHDVTVDNVARSVRCGGGARDNPDCHARADVTARHIVPSRVREGGKEMHFRGREAVVGDGLGDRRQP